ncbi:MAG: protein phosphatase 2C domain-containing protein [Anaerolineales bacterium]
MKGLFQKVFSRKHSPTTEVPTEPIPPETVQLMEEAQRVEPRQLIVGSAQSVGRQRDHNEDALLTLTSTLTSDYSNAPFGLFIVADGMGGHHHGEIASGIAIRDMASYIVSKLYTSILSFNPISPEESIQEIMQTGVQDAHLAITKQVPGGGTTLTAALILGKQLTIAHVGDSRAYLLGNDNHIEVLTRDHSLVKRLVELGQITKDEAAIHPQRNVLYRALGQGEPFDADIKTTPLPPSSYLLLCSDGLWGVVPDADIYRMVMESTNPESACQNLIDAANRAGGPDNITVILVRLPEQ